MQSVKNIAAMPDMVAYTYNPGTQEVEIRLGVQQCGKTMVNLSYLRPRPIGNS